MRRLEQIKAALELSSQGLNSCEVSRRTGIPRGTVRAWVNGALPRSALTHPDRASCIRCGAAAHELDRLDPRAYAYLLGLYLGDGSPVKHRRGVWLLRIVLDNRYPGIIAESASAVSAVLRGNVVRVQRRSRDECSEVQVYSKQLACLCPQPAAGPSTAERSGWSPGNERSPTSAPGSSCEA